MRINACKNPVVMATSDFATQLWCCCVFLLCIANYSCCSLTPPSGNSIALSPSTTNGVVTYRCQNEKWIPISIAAMLTVSASKDVGNYSRTFSTPQHVDGGGAADVGTWSLLNNDGDAAESGQISSQVSGKLISPIASNTDAEAFLQDFLAQASNHQFDGEATRVSYIMQTGATHGALPAGSCGKGSTVKVTFEAKYTIWEQDMVPPPTMPPQIAVDANSAQIAGFFAEGSVAYRAGKGLAWEMKGAKGKLYDVPGGVNVGSFQLKGSFYKTGDASFMCLFIQGANNAQFYPSSTCAQPSTVNAKPVVMDSQSLSWSLMRVTKTIGEDTAILGKPSSLQMVSTLGGLAPTSPPSNQKDRYKANFTAIFWIYKHQN